MRLWKLREPAKQAELAEAFEAKVRGVVVTSVEEQWSTLKDSLKHAAEQVCGVSKKHQWRKETWWWNDLVESAIREKRSCYKAWKAGGSREAYNAAKREANRAVYQARQEAQKVAVEGIDPKTGDIYRLAKQMRRENQGVVGEKPVKNDDGALSLDEDAKKLAWKQHYQRLLNIEFPWRPEDLSTEPPVEGPSERITHKMISEAVRKMSLGKAAGPSGIVAEMLKPCGNTGIRLIRDLIEAIIREGHIPSEWEESYIVSLYKGKGDALERGNYRGLKLIDQVLKVLERVVEQLITKKA